MSPFALFVLWKVFASGAGSGDAHGGEKRRATVNGITVILLNDGWRQITSVTPATEFFLRPQNRTKADEVVRGSPAEVQSVLDRLNRGEGPE